MVPITDEHRRRWAEPLIPPAPPDGPRRKREKRRFHLMPPYGGPVFDGVGIGIGLAVAVIFCLALSIVTYWYFAVSAGLFPFALYQTIRQRRSR